MAIQNNIAEGASQYGIAFNNAYYRIVTASVSRQRGTDPKFSVMIDLSAYATSTPTDDTREVDFKRYNADLDSVMLHQEVLSLISATLGLWLKTTWQDQLQYRSDTCL